LLAIWSCAKAKLLQARANCGAVGARLPDYMVPGVFLDVRSCHFMLTEADREAYCPENSKMLPNDNYVPSAYGIEARLSALVASCSA